MILYIVVVAIDVQNFGLEVDSHYNFIAVEDINQNFIKQVAVIVNGWCRGQLLNIKAVEEAILMDMGLNSNFIVMVVSIIVNLDKD